MVDYDCGFTFREIHSSEEGQKPKVFWQYPYERLRMSADDGHRILWLDFGGEDGEKVTIVQLLRTYLYLRFVEEVAFNSLLG